ncbi:MAG: hypothetical protein JSW46_13460 [Gemmatimonadota bacterium]|nr:MAG: hypothetical protein JSW46_13460 [Gemmatimonadota bacterium]
MRTISALLGALAALGSISCSSSSADRNTAAESRAITQTVVNDIDGNEYRTATIGEQVWMAENLRVTRSPGGQPLTSFFFNDDSIGYATCGRMYTWEVAMGGAEGETVQGICPDGWHLPSDADWTTTFEFVEGQATGGRGLLTGGFTGFEAQLCGGADFRGNYLYFNELALLWSSTEVNDERAYHHHVASDGELGKFAAMKGARIYVRCLRD